MEFWGVEVKPGQSLVVKPGVQKYLHLSQATLGEIKKDKSNENVTIFLKIGDQKLVLGILSGEKFPQLSFDLVFEKEFEISHNGKGGSVYCAGYQAFADDQEQCDHFDSDSDSGSEDEELALPPSENGKSQKEKSISEKSNAAKAASVKKADVKPLKPSEDVDDDEDEDSDEEFDEDMLEADSDDSDDSDDDSESDEETPKKVEQPKKRSNESASKKTPVPSKKAKLASPEKTDGKKGGHPATPHPAKKTGKTPAKSVSPKSAGHISCKSCEKTFNSDGALQSHSKAKHAGK